jgi:hypothetical protein
MLDSKELKTAIERRRMNRTEMYKTAKTAGTEVEPMLYHSNYETEGILLEATRK